jgi:hypothetical protein
MLCKTAETVVKRDFETNWTGGRALIGMLENWNNGMMGKKELYPF